MWALLTLPPEANLISGNNPRYIGDMNIGGTTSVNWTIVFTADGLFYVNVKAYGYRMDTGGYVEKAGYRSVNVTDPPPEVFILSPENTTYSNSRMPLTFTLNEPVDWIGYSLDGQANITIAGNTTLYYIPDGSHSIIVYAKDTAGNIGNSDSVSFTVEDTTSPTVTVLSPVNKTYGITSIPLTFYVDESVSWIGYSLDGQSNVTISSNTTLSMLDEGLHNLIIFAEDFADNIGASNITHFTFMLMHDVEVSLVTTSKIGCTPKETVGQGYNLTVYVEIKNAGSYTETVNVTAYSEFYLLGYVEVTLSSGQDEIISFTWNTLGFTKGNYWVCGNVSIMPDEYNLTNNGLCSLEEVFVTIPGDIDGDRDVDIFDIVRMSAAYGTSIGNPKYEPNSDVDDDGIINIFDVVRAAMHYGQNW